MAIHIAFNLLANIYLESGLLFDSYQALNQAMDLANKINTDDKYILNGLHLTRGLMHFLSAEFQKAEFRYSKVLNSFSKNQKKNTYLQVRSTNLLAEVKAYQGHFDMALKLSAHSLREAERNDYLDLKIQGLFIESKALLGLEKFSDATEKLYRAEREARFARMEYWITKTSLVQSELKSASGEFENALSIIEESIGTSSSRGFRLLRIDAMVTKAGILLASDKTKSLTQAVVDLLCHAERESTEFRYKLNNEKIQDIRSRLSKTNAQT